MTKFVACLAMIMCGLSCCSAQNDSLVIGPADQISIQVLEAPELTQLVRVMDNGYVPLIVGGEVKVAGLTPAQAAVAVEHALIRGHYLLNPHVSVTVNQYATENVTVIGQVRLPGSYPIGTSRSVLEVLALAGGTTELASRQITIEHRATGKKINYFLSNKSSTALDTSVRVFPGDIVVVPKIDVVYVLGDVPRAGGYPIATNNGKLTLLEAVALAGSPLPSSVPNHTRLIRRMPDGTYVEMQLPLGRIEKGKRQDVTLQADDIVYIPFSYLRNMATNLTALLAAASTAAIYHY